MTGQMPGDAITDAARTAFVNFWSAVGPWIAGGHADSEDVAHEAFHAGWQAALPALTGAITAQAAAAEREACALLADYYAEQIACHECGSEAAYSAASLIRSRSGLLGGTADGAHTPGGAT